MSNLCCPNCGSENTQSYSLAYDAFGTSSDSVRSYVDSDGHTHAYGGGSYHNRPDLAPPKMPRKADHDFPIVGCLTGCLAPIVAGILWWLVGCLFGFAWASFSYILAFAFVLVFVTLKKNYQNSIKEYEARYAQAMQDYKEQMIVYNRSYICLRCGNKFTI